MVLRRIASTLRPWPKHPIDNLYGIETSKRFQRFRLRTGARELDAANVGYVGSQPSILRQCLSRLPALDGAIFFDLGCGKGRMLATATEYPFKSIIGIELVPSICRVAERNAKRIAARHPRRTPVKVLQGDATRPSLPTQGNVVLFLYNPFHGNIIARLVEHLTASIAEHPKLKVFVVYYNPVHADHFDAMDGLQRYHAATYRFAADELRSSPFGNDHDSVVIWQSRSHAMHAAFADADRPVTVTVPDLVAVVQPD